MRPVSGLPKRQIAPPGRACGLCSTRLVNFGVTLGTTEILRDINLHIHCGEITALIGPNGAGKTTLLKAIVGDVPHTGELTFIDAAGVKTHRPLVGYVPQRLDFDPSSPTSVLDLFVAAASPVPVCLLHLRRVRAQVLDALNRVQCAHLAGRRLGELSGGELQRVLLALALEPKPDLLLLDEPVSAVDQNGMELFYSTVSELRRRYDLSIILVSHDLALVSRFADRIVFLNRTVQCSGTPDEVFRSEKMLHAFGPLAASAPGIEGAGR